MTLKFALLLHFAFNFGLIVEFEFMFVSSQFGLVPECDRVSDKAHFCPLFPSAFTDLDLTRPTGVFLELFPGIFNLINHMNDSKFVTKTQIANVASSSVKINCWNDNQTNKF